ncbi:hypothetical protein PHMEG_00027673 [Phytophthora megakarya]|uniref:Uncharacterized protein n=1 Tax=Phytophthora megakarya TaxID=4795 RepID=A0A225V7Z1_9STRA|nr:hypothetical protein PHMEG_00027673 [Phytophthora megakarya]
MMKYSTKNQKDVENPLALHIGAFEKAQSNADASLNAVQAGRRCMQSMCCSLSNAHEVAAPMASLYLLRSSAFYSSTSFAKLYLYGFVSALFGRDGVNVTLAEDENGANYKPSSSFLDYVFRPMDLDQLSLMEFTSYWKKCRNRTGLNFTIGHQQRATHSLHRREQLTVPCIIGLRLPNIQYSNLPADILSQTRIKLLILFKPFRSRIDFGQMDSNDIF